MLQESANIGFAATQVIALCLQLGGRDRTALVLNQRIQSFDLPLECIGNGPQPRMCIVTDTLLRRAAAGQTRDLPGQVCCELARHIEPGPLIQKCCC